MTPSRLLTHALMLALAAIALFPLYWMVVTSFRAENAIFSTALLPLAPSLDNYRFVLERVPMLRLIGNTAIVAFATMALQVLTSILAAYALARFPSRLVGVAHTLIALSWLVPFQVTMIPNYVLAGRLGLLDTLTGLVLPNAVAAFGVLLLYHAMKAFPREVIEAARMDGARSWRVLWDIIVPNLRPAIASLAILAFISAWNEYFWPLLLTRNIENAVVQIGLEMFMTQEGNLWGALMAAATLASLPILAVYAVLQRHVVDSFMKSGIR